MIRPAIALLYFKKEEGNETKVSAEELVDYFVLSDEEYTGQKVPERFVLEPIYKKEAQEEYKLEIVSHFSSIFWRQKKSVLEKLSKEKQGELKQYEAIMAFVFIDETYDENAEIVVEMVYGSEEEEGTLPVEKKTKTWLGKVLNGHDIDKNVCVFFDKEMRWDGTKIKSGESTNYYTATGKTRFNLTFKENVNGKEKSINVKLDTHSPMGDDNYFEMVEELIAVYDDIVMDSESKSSLSEGNSWSKELDKLSHILKKMSPMAETQLEKVETKLPYHKVRRFTSKTFIDLSNHPGAPVRTLVNKESYDIYEHRMIRRYLDCLEWIAQRRKKIAEEFEKKAAEEKENYLSTFEKEWESSYRTEYEENHKNLEELTQIEIPLRFKKVPEYKKELFVEWDSGKRGSSICDSSIKNRKVHLNNAKGNSISLDAKRIEKLISKEKYKENLEELFFRNHFRGNMIAWCGIAVSLTEMSVILELLKKLEELKSQSNALDQYSISFFLRFKFDTAYKNHLVLIEKIEIYKDGSEGALVEINQNEDVLKMHFSEVRRYAEAAYNEVNNDVPTLRKVYSKRKIDEKREWEEVLKKIEKIKYQIPFLSCVQIRQGENLHITNLFGNDKHYKQIYHSISKIPEEYYAISFDAGKKIAISKACNIFEYWCLYKMLWIFVEEYKFESANPQKDIKVEMKEKMEEYFNNPVDSMGNPEGIVFKLKKTFDTDHFDLREEEDIEVDIIFQGELDKAIGNGVYRPDYMLKIREKVGNRVQPEKLYVLDAKYRDFVSQGTVVWCRTLCDVVYKYMVNSSVNVDGVYILHSDMKKMESGLLSEDQNDRIDKVDLGGYYGSKVNQLIKNIKKKYPSYKKVKYESKEEGIVEETLEDCLLKYFREKEWNGHIGAVRIGPYETNFRENEGNGHIGAVRIGPYETKYFKNLVRMIMERFVAIDYVKTEERDNEFDYDKYDGIIKIGEGEGETTWQDFLSKDYSDYQSKNGKFTIDMTGYIGNEKCDIPLVEDGEDEDVLKAYRRAENTLKALRESRGKNVKLGLKVDINPDEPLGVYVTEDKFDDIYKIDIYEIDKKNSKVFITDQKQSYFNYVWSEQKYYKDVYGGSSFSDYCKNTHQSEDSPYIAVFKRIYKRNGGIKSKQQPYIKKFCWMCGHNEFVSCDENYNGVGSPYMCTNKMCEDRFMIETWCENCGKEMIKHGITYNIRRFHSNGNRWNHMCPRCGKFHEKSNNK